MPAETMMHPPLDRRRFLAYFSSLGLAGTLLPGILWSNAAGAATETVEELFVRAHRERGGFFVVEWAARRIIFAGFAQIQPRADDIDDIHSVQQVVDKGLRDAFSHAGLAVQTYGKIRSIEARRGCNV